MKVILIISALMISLSGFAASDTGTVDDLILHQKTGLEKEKQARLGTTDAKMKKFFDDMISAHEEDLKRLTEMRDRLSLFSQQDTFPGVQVQEDKNGYVVRASVPGMNQKDVKVSMTGNHLVISGRHEEQMRQEEKGAQRLENSSAEFVRTVPFDKKVDPSSMKVNFMNNVIEVSLKKAGNKS